jgi:3-oxoacyl-[acyl-carrier protein] reductase
MKSKKVLILGASSDIGLKTIDLYLNKGWKVFCHYNQNNKKLLTLKKNKKNIQLIQLNFKTQNNLEKKIKIKFNHGYHTIINLIGYIDNKSFMKTKLKDTILSLTINALVPNLIIKNNLNYMTQEKWGRIVNGSALGIPYGGGEYSFNYNLSKHCLEFIPGKFKDWAKKNILINNLRIGHTDTKIHKKMKKSLFGKKRIKLIPINRMAKAKEMAEYLYFFGSEKNSFMTNETISSTGGE